MTAKTGVKTAKKAAKNGAMRDAAWVTNPRPRAALH